MKAAGIQVKHCALAAAIALVLTPAAPVMAQNAGASSQASASEQAEQTYQFDIPAKPLPQAITDLSAVTGLQVFYTEQSTFDHTAPALQGNYSVRDALQQLLAGSGLVMRFTGDNSVTIELASQDGVQTLPPVRITGTTIADGSVESGYVSEEVSQVGPWQGRSLQDTPYSINVVSESLIENIQATTSPDKIFMINPVTQFSQPQSSRGYNGVMMRGFSVANSARNGIDRAGSFSSEGLIMEEVGRVEILTGTSGFLYGGDNVGGTINYVTKRPTEKRLTNITLGTTSGQNVYLHGDFGGKFDAEGNFGYRINMVTQDGETYIGHQKIDRDSISAAFDWQVTDKLMLDVNLYWRDYLIEGRQPLWVLSDGAIRPEADDIDSSKLWGQKWTFNSIESKRSEIGLLWNVSDNITFRGRYSAHETEKEEKTNVLTLQNDDAYSARFQAQAPYDYQDEQGYAYLDLSFETGFLSHKLTTGFQFGNFSIDRPNDPVAFVNVEGFGLETPTYVPERDWAPYGMQPKSTWRDAAQRMLTVGDEITFNGRWSALIGISDVEIESFSYKESKLTPTLSLLYKPQPWFTTYISYIEALEQGGVAGDIYQTQSVTNAGEIMDPLASEQIELGAKATIGGMLITAALFEIDKPLEYYSVISNNQVVFVQDGRQVHRGLEVTSTGNLTDNLTLVGGFTLLDAQIKDNEQSPELEGKTPTWVAEEMYKAHLEYNLPTVPGLTLSGGISYTGDSYGDTANTDKLDGYTSVDMGARYQMNIADKPLTLRFNINNVTDERYWVNSLFLSDARTVSFSANMEF